MSLAILFHFLCAQYISVRCVLEFRCGWIGVVSVLQAASACNTDTTPTQSQEQYDQCGNSTE